MAKNVHNFLKKIFILIKTIYMKLWYNSIKYSKYVPQLFVKICYLALILVKGV